MLILKHGIVQLPVVDPATLITVLYQDLHRQILPELQPVVAIQGLSQEEMLIQVVQELLEPPAQLAVVLLPEVLHLPAGLILQIILHPGQQAEVLLQLLQAGLQRIAPVHTRGQVLPVVQDPAVVHTVDQAVPVQALEVLTVGQVVPVAVPIADQAAQVQVVAAAVLIAGLVVPAVQEPAEAVPTAVDLVAVQAVVAGLAGQAVVAGPADQAAVVLVDKFSYKYSPEG
jgi:hypothetical protein